MATIFKLSSGLVRRQASYYGMTVVGNTRLVAATRSNAILMRYMSSLPSHEVVGLPALSPTMTHGNLTDWKKKEGDTFSPGEVICSVETDKATVDFEAQDDGFVAKILVEAGAQEIAVGTPIFVSVESEDDVAAFKDFKAEPHPEPANKEVDPAAVSTPSRPAPQPDVVPLDNKGKPVAPGDFLVTVVAPQPSPQKAPVPSPTPASTTSSSSASTSSRASESPKPVAAAAPPTGAGKPAAPKPNPLAFLLAAQQKAYLDKFGATGTNPISVPVQAKN